jgi:hypothetical protein
MARMKYRFSKPAILKGDPPRGFKLELWLFLAAFVISLAWAILDSYRERRPLTPQQTMDMQMQLQERRAGR